MVTRKSTSNSKGNDKESFENKRLKEKILEIS
jgi:hypothetical protein